MGDFDAGGQQLREAFILAVAKMVEHGVAGLGRDDFFGLNHLDETDHFIGGGAAEPELLTALGSNRRGGAEDEGVDLGVGQAEFFHLLVGGGEADFAQDEVGAGVIRVGDHEADRVAKREGGTGGKLRGEDAAAGSFVLFTKGDRVGEAHSLFGRLAVGLNHDGQLNKAGRGHGLVGFVGERVALGEMFHRDGDIAFVGINERGETVG